MVQMIKEYGRREDSRRGREPSGPPLLVLYHAWPGAVHLRHHPALGNALPKDAEGNADLRGRNTRNGFRLAPGKGYMMTLL